MRSEPRRRCTSALAALALSAPLGAELVERIVAVVDASPILLSEVLLVEQVRKCGREEAQRLLIEERLMFREASRLPQATLGPEDEELAYRSLLEVAGIAEPSGTLADDLRAMARRQLAILKYIDFRFKPQVRVTEQALREAYAEAYAGQPAPPSYESVEAALQARLFDRELSARIEAWVKELRAGADIRLVP